MQAWHAEGFDTPLMSPCDVRDYHIVEKLQTGFSQLNVTLTQYTNKQKANPKVIQLILNVKLRQIPHCRDHSDVSNCTLI